MNYLTPDETVELAEIKSKITQLRRERDKIKVRGRVRKHRAEKQ